MSYLVLLSGSGNTVDYMNVYESLKEAVARAGETGVIVKIVEVTVSENE